ncbi:NAD(P)H-binding protein [Zhihengliuella alba]|uniref:NAD(P)H-binding protein n=1 Tax=Zhihengliuella alba TaxID=547018 RepID=A0ABP7E386_9MICC
MRIAIAGGTGTVGRHVVDVATERGHDVVVLSRSAGVDLTSPQPLDLAGVDAVVDVASIQTASAGASRAFFAAVTTKLLSAAHRAGVGHLVALSIVGSDVAPFGYYAGKAEQERLVSSGPVPWTILRATQFHEFAGQILERMRTGPFSVVPAMRSQPVAAREVAERLVELVETGPAGHAADLAGPRVERMADLSRRWAEATGTAARVLEVPVPGRFGRALRDGTLLPGAGADRGRLAFADWLAG